ncbi:leucine-rich melanocyte differentiation-associated protein-like [Uranotaenia lowii]|uniref:leucine-rich melanocyte differentiation-associated protein-like n=1 Tax=Uranotaenia lowii TaxID=190385 RepID=UPI002479C1D5|nr:leucine-rich melanocyte differentiation-associated protein-like [Uranotaenia lowii]XP_055587334.1 leucine-rich melanocyte differentiation-associated protein-like [Uranotaenia lowii]
MDDINWNKIIFIENEQKLIYFDQKTYKLPMAILNLYSDRVRHLDLSFNKLSSFESLELFTQLEELVLDNNSLTDDIIFPAQLNRVKLLSLNNNKFVNLDLLLTKLSLCFPNLEYLSLLGNPACPCHLLNPKNTEYDYLKYRLYIIRYLPRIIILDAQRVKKMERDFVRNQQRQQQDDDSGSTSSDGLDNSSSSGNSSPLRFFYTNLSNRFGVRRKESPVYNPLPESIREAGDHRGAYGKCRYRYIGAQSEGNRFILNTDL